LCSKKYFFSYVVKYIMDEYIGPMTNSFIDKLISVASKEIKKKKTKQKIIRGIIVPLLKDISARYNHYLMTLSSILIIIIVLLVIILILLVISRCENQTVS
jgi:hypothetical protein